jgi:hypothetical protein
MACASVTSEPKPSEGQKNRWSGNFSTQNCSGSRLKWNCPAGIVFNVMKDVSGGTDPVIFRDITNGTVTDMNQDRSLYIANPRNAGENFTVSVDPVD